MTRVLAVASGKKWVSLVGLVITALGFICLDHRTELDNLISSEWAERLCGAITIIGSLMASFGRGLADRRNVRHKEHA